MGTAVLWRRAIAVIAVIVAAPLGGAWGAEICTADRTTQLAAIAPATAGQHEQRIAEAEAKLKAGDAAGALANLKSVIADMGENADPATLSIAYGVMGLAQSRMGDRSGARGSFAKSAELATQSQSPGIAVRSQLNATLIDVELYEQSAEVLRGRSTRAGVTGTRGDDDGTRGKDLQTLGKQGAQLVETLDKTARNAEAAGEHRLAIEALTTAALLALDLGAFDRARQLATQAQNILENAALGDERARLAIAVGNVFTRFVEIGPPAHRSWAMRSGRSVLSTAQNEAQRRGDRYLQSYATGILGTLDALEGKTTQALALTRQALILVIAGHTTNEATELELRWRGQIAALLQRLGRNQEALAAYEGTLGLVERVRPLIAQVDPITGESFFRQTVEPVLLAYTELLLDQAAQGAAGATSNVNLFRARERIETLKALEVENYFQESCRTLISGKQIELGEVSDKSVIVYPILFDDGLRILASSGTSNITLVRPAEQVTPRMVETAADGLRVALQSYKDTYKEPSRQLYDWLIKPLIPFMTSVGADTIVIVPDGALRSIPFAVLMDENGKFLIENGYAVASMVGLSLSEGGARHGDFRPLYIGVTEKIGNFSALPAVKTEVSALQSSFARGPLLIDKGFTKERLERVLGDSRFNIIHFATHGVFGGRRDNSFILTGDGLRDPRAGRLTIPELEQMVEKGRIAGSDIDILGLSACETAIGNDQVVLGLAGVAFKAGAKSVFASLWNINDAATARLVPMFYGGLKQDGMTKAKALRAAQLEFLKRGGRFAAPGYWGAFIVLGNWE